MGGVQGVTSDKGKPLFPQRNFERTIHRRFIKDPVVTLELQDQFWSQPREHPIEIKDVAHDKVLFKVPPVSMEGGEPPKRKLLLDAYGVPVVGMEEHNIPPVTANHKAFAVIPDGFTATKELFRFETIVNMFEWPLTLALDDHSPDAASRIVIMGQWLTREAAIAIQRKGGDFYMIARTYPVGSLLDGVYRMDIAPGVDVALMVLFAAAMDQEKHKYERSSERLRFRNLVRKQVKEEKKQLKAQQKLEKNAQKEAPAATAS